jgi:D-xylose transport system substrate-binding protein
MSTVLGLRRIPLMLAALLLLLGLVAAGCGGDDETTGGGGEAGGGGGGGTIAILLPENETPRYEAADRPYLEEGIKKECPECEILYNNADGDIAKQQSQVEAALTQGADVLILDPMDAASAAGSVEKAKQQDVPVVSYDRLILESEPDVYVSFDNEKVGELQAETLAKKLKEDGSPKGPIVMISGDPADSNAAGFKAGAEKGFDAAGVEVAKSYDTPEWSATNAQNEMQQAITAIGKDGFAGVYAANDDTGGGAIAAMKAAGINPAERPTTGQDATVAGLQRILVGQQYMTVYKAVKPEAFISAEFAVALMEGEEGPQDKVNAKLDNEKTKIPSVLLNPEAITKDKVNVVIKDEYVTVDEVCTGQYAQACKEAGIS